MKTFAEKQGFDRLWYRTKRNARVFSQASLRKFAILRMAWSFSELPTFACETAFSRMIEGGYGKHVSMVDFPHE